MSPHLSPLAEVLTWTGLSGYLALMAVLIARAAQVSRRHDARIARYEAARAANAEHWETVRRVLDGDPPPECDPLIVSEPKNPQRGEG